jgi:rubredoxin
LPIVTEHAVGYLECRLRQSIDAGSHTIFVGLVANAEMLRDGPPMTYAYYHDVKRGQTQENAPTYVTEADGKEKQDMPSYRCTICGYVYDPKAGDPDAGVKPGTSFESLPADWVCPVCGAAKDKFVKVE